MRAILCLLLLAMPVLADDWTGKSIQVKEAVKLGRKVGDGLVREGSELDPKKTYSVKSDTGTLLELADGWIFKFEGTVAADAKPLPKEKAKDTDPAKDKGEWFGKKVLPKRHSSEIRIGDWEDDKQVYWVPHNLLNCTVREDRGGFLRLYDGRREGWVAKEDMVTAEDAPAWWDKEVKANPNSDYAWWMRGVGWSDKGEYDNAIKDLTESIRLKPDDSAAYNARGKAWSDKKDYDKAIADYTEAIRSNPKGAILYSNRGVVWSRKKEYDKAIADHDEAIRLDPKEAAAFYNRGISWKATKDYDRAISDYTEAIRLDLKYTDAFYNRGITWYIKKEYDKAIADYTEVIRLNPKYAGVFYGRGSAWYVKKEYNKAIEDYNEAIRLDPKDVSAYSYRGRTRKAKKEYDKAIEDYNEAIRLDPKTASAFNGLSWLQATCPDAKYRDGKKAVEYGKKAVELNPLLWNNHGTLAAAYAESGDFELAVAEQRKAIEMLKADKSTDADDLKKAEVRLQLYRKRPVKRRGSVRRSDGEGIGVIDRAIRSRWGYAVGPMRRAADGSRRWVWRRVESAGR